MLSEEQKIQVESARGLADWLEVDFTISIFGRVIVSWHFPPRKKGGVK